MPAGEESAEESRHGAEAPGAKLYDTEIERQTTSQNLARKTQVGSGDRSEKIRTYNFPQDRVTDHRIGLTVHNLPAIMDGGIAEIVQQLRAHDQAERLRKEVGGIPGGAA